MTVMATEAAEHNPVVKRASTPKKKTSASVAPTGKKKKKSSPGSGTFGSFFTGGGRYSEKHYRRILAAEFTFGIVLLTWENLTDQQPLQVTVNGVTHTVPHMKQFGAWAVAFFLLALLTTGGTRMSKIASQIGGLMLGALMLRPVSDGHGKTTFAGSNMLAALAALFSDNKSSTQDDTPPDPALEKLLTPPSKGGGATQGYLPANLGNLLSPYLPSKSTFSTAGVN